MHYIYHAGDLAFALEYLLLSYDFYLSIDSTFEIISIGNETIETLCKLGRISEAEQFYQTLLAHFKSKGEQSQYIQFCFLLSEFTIAIGKKELKLQQEILVPLRQKLSHFNNKKELIIGYIPNLLLHYTNLFLATNDVSQIDSTFNKEIKLYLDAIKTESNFLTFNTLELVYKFYTLTNLKGKDSFFVFYIDYIQKTNALRNDVLLHDIKVKYQTNAILEKLNSEKELNIKLKEINNSLTNFAAIAAHDLKAPLRTISDFSRILSNRYASVIAPEDKIMFDFIIKGAGNLNNLINDLLAFSKLEYNRMDNSIVDLDSILKEVTQILSSSIKDCSAQIQYTSLPRVKGQSTLLAQLFLNLINNSIKFRKKDEQLVIQIKCEKENDKYFTISFTDNGIGIDKPQHNAVFEPFKKLHSSSEYEGNGIGLATCKKIITFYGGTIHIESELGKGTNIIFTLLRAD
jgi:signal transduction histidine kinase